MARVVIYPEKNAHTNATKSLLLSISPCIKNVVAANRASIHTHTHIYANNYIPRHTTHTHTRQTQTHNATKCKANKRQTCTKPKCVKRELASLDVMT